MRLFNREPEEEPRQYEVHFEHHGGRNDCDHPWLRNEKGIWRRDASSASMNVCLDCGKEFRQWSTVRENMK